MEVIYEPLTLLSPRELEKGLPKVPQDKGYPEERLKFTEAEWAEMVQAGTIVIPEGPWSMADHPSRQDPKNPHRMDPVHTLANPMTAEQVQHWHGLGLLIDTAGRALHPRAAQMLTTIGMFTQLGEQWEYGPKTVGNFGLRRVRNGLAQYLTVGVDRDEGGRLRRSLPGGYPKPGESADKAITRELFEETGVHLTQLGNLATLRVVTPPHPFWKNTLHAWTSEEYTFAMSHDNPGLEGVTPIIHDTKEVVEIAWMSEQEITLHPDFLGAHRKQVIANEARYHSSSGGRTVATPDSKTLGTAKSHMPK